MPTKDRLLVLLKILMDNSDEDTWLTTAEIRARMEAVGQEGCIRTLRKNIASLQSSGFEIGIRETNGMPTEYAYLGREWSKPELQILVDAVSSAQFIPEARSKELTEKLAAMAGPSHTEELKPQILISEHIKAKNRNMIYSVQAIRRGIEQDRKIVFRYLRYTPEMKQVPKHAGEEADYVVSPYATVWNNDRYYLVGWSNKREKVTVFRIDRMEVPTLTEQRRVPPPDDFDVRDYTDKVFWMFDGPKENVTLRCRMDILDQVVDRFGERVNLRILDSSTFEINVPVSITGTFFAWVFQFTGEMKILRPGYVKDKYIEMLRSAMNDAHN